MSKKQISESLYTLGLDFVGDIACLSAKEKLTEKDLLTLLASVSGTLAGLNKSLNKTELEEFLKKAYAYAAKALEEDPEHINGLINELKKIRNTDKRFSRSRPGDGGMFDDIVPNKQDTD